MKGRVEYYTFNFHNLACIKNRIKAWYCQGFIIAYDVFTVSPCLMIPVI